MPVTLADARLPEGLRVYAIGDVHGDVPALESMRRKIDEDLARRPAQDWREVWLGDYVDRGPDSRGVIEALISWPEVERRICLRGNHDDYMHLFVEHGDPAILSQWLANGGITAVASYGLSIERLLLGVDRSGAAALQEELQEIVPAAHRQFLRDLPSKLRLGDFGFAHAGIRPGLAWDAQSLHDLTWIRDAFLDHPGPHDLVIVHGHTPVHDIEMTPARIGIDTGCGKGGFLSGIVIEGGMVARLTVDGPEPLA